MKLEIINYFCDSTNKMNNKRVSFFIKKVKSEPFDWLLTLWIASAIFETLFYFPFLQYKLQIFELLFLFVFFFLAKDIIPGLVKPFPLRIPLLIYSVFIFFNLLFFFDKTTVAGNLGNFYTFLIPITFFTLGKKAKNSLRAIERGLLIAAILMPISCLLSYLIFTFGVSETYVFKYVDYPYLGDIVRVKGFTTTPNEVVFISSTCLFFILFNSLELKRNYKILLCIFILTTLFFTYSKEIIIIPIAIFIGYFLTKKKWILFSCVSTILAITFISMITFLYFSSEEKLKEKDYLDRSEIVFGFKKIKAYPTAYLWLNRSGRKMIQENPMLGVGFGNFSKEIDRHKLQGFYPQNLPSLRAHDNYIGLVAQYGLGFLLFLGALIFNFRKILRNDISSKNKMFIATSLVFILIFGFTQLSYNSRWMWMFFGIVMIIAVKEKEN
jgi:hypothetical protein